MPKQIPDLKERIVKEARLILLRDGYGALSMRALARQCAVAPGTLYNYFPGKDDVVAAVMLQDWAKCLEKMNAYAAAPHPLAEGFGGLCRLLEEYTALYRPAWQQYGAGGQTVNYTARYHRVLRAQLAEPLAAALRGAGREDLAPLAPLLAETMLACAMNEDLGSAGFRRLAVSWENGPPVRDMQKQERG